MRRPLNRRSFPGPPAVQAFAAERNAEKKDSRRRAPGIDARPVIRDITVLVCQKKLAAWDGP